MESRVCYLAESGAAGGTRRWACPGDDRRGYRSIREYGEYGAYGSIPIDALADLDDDYGPYYPVVASSDRTNHRQVFGKAKTTHEQGQVISPRARRSRLRIFRIRSRCSIFSDPGLKSAGLNIPEMKTAYEITSRRIGISAVRDDAAVECRDPPGCLESAALLIPSSQFIR